MFIDLGDLHNEQKKTSSSFTQTPAVNFTEV